MNKLFHTSIFVLAVAAVGCGDGTDIAATGPDTLPLPGSPGSGPAAPLSCSTLSFAQTSAVDALPGGIWMGSLADCANGAQYGLITAIVSEDGQFRIIGENSHVLAGTLQTSGDLFQGRGTDFAPAGVEYFSGPTTDMFVEGRVTERQTMEGRWGTEWGFYGYFSFEYRQQTYERATSLADIAGVWPSGMTHAGKPVEGVWTIEPDGRFDGQDGLGCLHSGQFSVIDERYSVVSVQFTILGCELAGSYGGLAYLEDLVDFWEKAVTISVDDGTRAVRILLAIERP